MGKFKDLVTGKKEKERLDEAVGGVVSTPAINQGHGSAIQSTSGELSGDSRIDTGGKFTFRADQLPDSQTKRSKPATPNQQNEKQAFAEQNDNSVVLHEDEGGSVTLREGNTNYEVVIRAGSQEKIFELDAEAAQQVQEFFK